MSRLPGGNSSGRPWPVRVIAGVLAAEALALFSVAGWYAQGLFTQTASSVAGAIFTLVLLIACAVWISAVAHYLFRGFRWTRSAALVAQFFMLAIGLPTLFGGVLVPGMLMVFPPALVIGLLFSPPVLAFTHRRADGTPVL